MLSKLSIGIAVALLTTGAAFASDAVFTATFQNPVSKDSRPVMEGISWECSGTGCVSRSATGNSSPRASCAALARRFGEVKSFNNGDQAIDAAALAKCNQSAKK